MATGDEVKYSDAIGDGIRTGHQVQYSDADDNNNINRSACAVLSNARPTPLLRSTADARPMASDPRLDLSRAPYVLYGGGYIDLVFLW